MRIHALELGWLQFPKGWTKSRGALGIMRSLVRGKGGPPDRIPMVGYVIEHDDGHIVIDSGARSDVVRRRLPIRGLKRTNRRLRRFVDEFPTLILPSHDAEAAQNIAGWRPVKI